MSLLQSDYASKKKLRTPLLSDLGIVAIAGALVLFGILMIYSTTGVVSNEKFGDSLFYVKRQILAGLIGAAAMFAASKVSVDFLRRISPYCIVAALVLLFLTLIPGLGHVAGGARRWIKLGPLRFEPAEGIKILVTLFLAGFLARHEATLDKFQDGILKPGLIAGVVGALLLKQPDFGSASVIALVILIMTTAAGARLRYVLLGALIMALAGGVLVWISPYRMHRVMSFLDPFADASGKGYQLLQSLIAVGTGQVTGVGLGESSQKLFFLPAAHTDFIFAVISEELGFVGGVSLICVFLLFLYRGLKIASALAEDTFSYSLAVGLTMLIVMPALLNVGVVIGLLPTKGMVLPLVGYGGSSLIACMICVGLLFALGKSRVERPQRGGIGV